MKTTHNAKFHNETLKSSGSINFKTFYKFFTVFQSVIHALTSHIFYLFASVCVAPWSQFYQKKNNNKINRIWTEIHLLLLFNSIWPKPWIMNIFRELSKLQSGHCDTMEPFHWAKVGHLSLGTKWLHFGPNWLLLIMLSFLLLCLSNYFVIFLFCSSFPLLYYWIMMHITISVKVWLFILKTFIFLITGVKKYF
jgi:hypothetical protein